MKIIKNHRHCANFLWFDDSENESLVDIIAQLDEKTQAKIMSRLSSTNDCNGLKFKWEYYRRPKQRIPFELDYDIFLILGGRGSGVTRTLTESARDVIETRKAKTVFMFGLTQQHVRQTMIEGDSGIKNIVNLADYKFNPSYNLVECVNGGQIRYGSLENIAALRGYKFGYFVIDNPSWDEKLETALDVVKFGLREGALCKMAIGTSIPENWQQNKYFTALLKNPRVLVWNMGTGENFNNLPKTYVEHVRDTYINYKQFSAEF